MRTLSALVLISLLAAGCTPYIPVKDAFGVSALRPAGTIPPEFAEFNSYDPRVDIVLADQICATPYQLQLEQSAAAAPGEIVGTSGRCEIYPGPLSTLTRAFQPGGATTP
jgi:hypothetical protein